MAVTKRDVVRMAIDHERPPYVPWSFGFTQEAGAALAEALGDTPVHEFCENHFIGLGNAIGRFEEIGDDCFRDVFGVVWDRSVDKDIGVVRGCLLPEPTLGDYEFPDPLAPRLFADIDKKIATQGDRYRIYNIGFSLYERAWTLRGMENLMIDFLTEPDFVHELFNTIVDYNIAQARKALEYDIDAVYFGDDWGQQQGLQMEPDVWREFIKPAVARQYAVVRDAGKRVMIHSCGDVDELFDDLIEIGVNCFNPFQPEVMDVHALMPRYKGRLAFHGGLSTQQTLPYGSTDDVRAETQRLLELGADGGYIFSPAHAVEGDVPVENILAFTETVKAQPGYAQL